MGELNKSSIQVQESAEELRLLWSHSIEMEDYEQAEEIALRAQALRITDQAPVEN